MKNGETLKDRNVLLSIQNNKKPEQLIYVVLDDAHKCLETQGLQQLFGVKEIRFETNDVLGSLEEYASVISFILDSISTASDLGLPFAYQDEFEFAGAYYSLREAEENRVLKKIEPVSL